MAQSNVAPVGAEAIGGFDALQILDYEFTVTVGGNEHTFETPKDADGRITSVNGGGKNRPVTYTKNEGTGMNFAGIEYEQVDSDLPDLVPPVINNVEITTMDPTSGIYKLSVSKADCTLDSRATLFFFFNSRDGVFENYKTNANGSASVVFRANPNTGGRNVRVVVGVGDDLGQIHRKSIFVKGVK